MNTSCKVLVVCVAFALLVDSITADKCDYSDCNKELSSCSKRLSKDKCIKKDGLYISYKEHLISFGREHVCCENWKLDDLSKKYLHCVTKIRSKEMECRDGTEKGYKLKFKTKKECNTFSCFK